METKTKNKGQSAVEFISTYLWAFLLLAFIIVGLYYFVGIPSQIIPARCSFLYGINCEGVNVGTNTLDTVVELYLVNGQEYDLVGNTIATVSITAAGTANAICVPSNVLQGEVMLCSITMPSKISVGQQTTGTLFLNSSVCLSGTASNCQA